MNSLNQAQTNNSLNPISTKPLESERHYRDSIYSLEQKLTLEPTCVESITAWITSYHQLAAIYQQRGDFQTAQRCLLIPHHSMLYMANSTQDEETELIAIRAINLTLPKLMAFAKVHSPCKKCMAELNQQVKVMEKRNKALH